MPQRTLDFLVTAVDNFGDTGFALDLAESLLSARPEWNVRFFSDNRPLFDRLTNGRPHPSVAYFELSEYESLEPAETVVSFFDRRLPEAHFAKFPFPKKILQLSYLRFDADRPGRPGVGSLNGTRYRLGNDEVVHLVPSPLPEGAGVVVNPSARAAIGRYADMGRTEARRAFFSDTGREERIPEDDVLNLHAVSAFFYPGTRSKIRTLVETLPEAMFVGFKAPVGRSKRVSGSRSGERETSGIGWFFRFLRFDEYEAVLPLFDANVVRGENSAVKAMLAGKPFLWDFYKEKNGAHAEKIDDFLAYVEPFFEDSTDFLAYSEALRAFNADGFDARSANACACILSNVSEGMRNAFVKASANCQERNIVENVLTELEAQ